jgi:hypothetical protein
LLKESEKKKKSKIKIKAVVRNKPPSPKIKKQLNTNKIIK